MSEKDQTSSRRTVLKLLGSSAVATAGVSQLSAAAKGDSTTVETLRGTKNSPLSFNEIKELRNRIVQKDAPTKESGAPRVALTDLEETVGDSRVLAYNIISDDSGVPREQFATRDGVADAPGAGTQQRDRLHDEADELLKQAQSENRNSDRVSTRDGQEDWSQWAEYGYTDVLNEFPKSSFGTRPGMVEFKNSVRNDPDTNRMGARVKINMVPGRQVCVRDNVDEFCLADYVEQDGYKNKYAEVVQEWKMPVNDTPTDDLVTGYDPKTQIDNVTTSRSASIGLDISKSGPAASVGYSSSVQLPGAELVNATTPNQGNVDHLFNINSPATNSSTNNAFFEVGSVSRWNPDCGSGFDTYNIVGIETEFEWGIDSPIGTWGNVVSHDQNFMYSTYC